MKETLPEDSFPKGPEAPVRDTFLPYARPQLEPEDLEAVAAVLKSEWLTTGPAVDAFEKTFAETVGAPFAVCFNSGTAALHAAAHAVGLGPGDEAITTPLTFCASANCALYVGATPRFADVDPETLTLSPQAVTSSLTKQTRAIIPVDYAGHPADLDAFYQIARDRKLAVIEDACHAPGAFYKDRPVGSLSDITVFSFHPVKHLTTGEGGMAVTHRAEFADRMRRFRSHGIDRDARKRALEGGWTYDMAELGYNYRLSDIGAALGLSQLKRLADNIARRRQLALYYGEKLKKIGALLLPSEAPWARSAWHLYPVRLRPERTKIGRDELLDRLKKLNIGGNFHYPPVHLHSYYRNRFGYRGGEFPVAEGAAATLLSLPMFHGMDEADVDDVAEALRIALG
jgi:UDP-4-amino-4,6-dideoxy-N-acetyl-beta-L-altrosamine transaminase